MGFVHALILIELPFVLYCSIMSVFIPPDGEQTMTYDCMGLNGDIAEVFCIYDSDTALALVTEC